MTETHADADDTAPAGWLRGRTVLVTGAAKRLGRATALELARRGADVAVHYHGSGDAAEAVAREARALGVHAWTVRADLGDPAQASAVVERARDGDRPVDAVVNNASVFPAGPLLTAPVEEFERVLRVNAWAPLLLARGLARQAEEGRVVNLLDTRILGHDRERAPYFVSKRALHDLTNLLALELAPRFTVNAVAPGLVLPPEGAGESHLGERRKDVPLRKRGYPEDVARAVAFLLESHFVTGQVVYVDGGQHLLHQDFRRVD